MKVVSYGGGVNSTALLIGMLARKITPDLILFAQTGGEFSETYDYVAAFSVWLSERGFPEITVVNNRSNHSTLEEECLTNGTLPSLAFGFKGCSAKWKRQPMDQYLRELEAVQAEWEAGRKVQRLIGIDAGESHRGKIDGGERYEYIKPLIDWGWNREDCVKAISGAGLCIPRKSACFFCPASKKGEVRRLARERAELFDRCVAMERNARDRGGLKTIKGLGRNYSWEKLGKAEKSQMHLFSEPPEIQCECFDGESYEEFWS